MKIIIFANGEINDYAAMKPATANADIIIACDGGFRHAAAMGVVPDVIIGDLDSAPPELLEEALAKGIAINPYPAEKDETDLELCITYANEKGAKEIKILGATGGRIDHALANLHMLALANCLAEILDEKTSVHLIKTSLTIPRDNYKTISLIPLTTEASGITTRGLAYPLNNETLYAGKSRGVSNVFNADEATISVTNGLLLAIRSSSAEGHSRDPI